MATTINNGNIIFGDGTQKATAYYSWSGSSSSVSGLTGVPTQLSQFTNDLGNYGSFLTSSATTTGAIWQNPNGTVNACGSGRGSIGHLTSATWGLTWDGSKLNLAVTNCNCACNC